MRSIRRSTRSSSIGTTDPGPTARTRVLRRVTVAVGAATIAVTVLGAAPASADSNSGGVARYKLTNAWPKAPDPEVGVHVVTGEVFVRLPGATGY